MYTDPLELMREMLKHWLKTAVDPPPTWEAVIAALRSPTVDKKKVAEQLEIQYCVKEQHEKTFAAQLESKYCAPAAPYMMGEFDSR